MSEKAVHLFPRNLDTDFYNYQKLRKLPGEMTTFTCKEEGDQHSLGRILAPKYLGLKSSCSVMLLVNFSDSLVNCLICTVRQIHTDSVDADFPMDDKAVTVNVVKHTFTTYDPVKKSFSKKDTASIEIELWADYTQVPGNEFGLCCCSL